MMKKTIRLGAILFSMMAFSLLLTSCSPRTEKASSAGEELNYKLLDTAKWKAECRLDADHVLWMSFENPEDKTYSCFALTAWQLSAADWYVCQKKDGEHWVDVGLNSALIFDHFPECIHAVPGEKQELPVNLEHWGGALKPGDSVRILLGMDRGELFSKDIFNRRPTCWLSFTCIYR